MSRTPLRCAFGDARWHGCSGGLEIARLGRVDVRDRPGCIANVLAILIVNMVIKPVDPAVDVEFDEMLATVQTQP